MTRSPILILFVGLQGCAPFLQNDRQGPEKVLENALISLDRGDFVAAYENLSWVHEHHWGSPAGERALLAMTAVEMNPRNPGRRIEIGAELGHRFADLPSPSPWNIPVAETFRLLAEEMTRIQAQIDALEEEKRLLERQRDETSTALRELRAEANQALARAEAAEAEVARARRAERRSQVAEAAAEERARTHGSDANAARESVGERDRLAQEVRALRNELAERDRELKRIRESLTPQ